MIAALVQNLLHPIFLPYIALAQKLDLNSVVGGQPLGILTQRIAKRLGR
jgi:hypothetical protein